MFILLLETPGSGWRLDSTSSNDCVLPRGLKLAVKQVINTQNLKIKITINLLESCQRCV